MRFWNWLIYLARKSYLDLLFIVCWFYFLIYFIFFSLLNRVGIPYNAGYINRVYNIVIRQFYALKCDDITNHLSPCKLITVLLTIFPFTFLTQPRTTYLLVTIPWGSVSGSGFVLFVYLFYSFRFHMEVSCICRCYISS